MSRDCESFSASGPAWEFTMILQCFAAHYCRKTWSYSHAWASCLRNVCQSCSGGANSINKLWLSEATLMMCIDMTALNVSRPLVWDVMSCTPLQPRWSEHELSMRLLYARIMIWNDMIWNDIASGWWWDTLKSYIHPVWGNNGDILGLTKYIFLWHILLYCYYASQVIKNACVYVFILSCKCHLQKTQTFNVHNFMTKLHAGSHCHYHEFFSLTMMTL